MFRRSPRTAVLVLLVIGVIGATGLMAQNDQPATASSSTTAKLVGQMVERFHVSQHALNDEISNKTFEKYLSDLDPMKLYLTKADIDSLASYRTELDDLTLEGDTGFAHHAYDLYLKRLTTRIAAAHKLIDSDFDFTADESILIDSEELPWATSEEEIHERWRKRIKYDVLSLMLDDSDDDKSKSDDPNAAKTPAPTLAEIRDRLHKRYRNIEVMSQKTEPSERLELYLSALTHSYDPHSSYMSPMTLKDFQISMELRLEGIGAELRSEDGYVTVNRVVEGGAAHKDGRLKANDRIIGVKQAGEEQYTDVVEMKLTRVVQLIRGDAGTVVWLQVKTVAGEVKEYELTRQRVELNDAAVRGEIIDTGERLNGRSFRIGVVNIPSFYRDFQGAQSGDENFRSTSRDVLKVLKQFQEQGGVDAMVVDLRFNGGGALTEAIEVTGLFVKEGPVVQVKDQDGTIESHNDEDDLVAYSGPLVVLCNRLSASASEIFAGAIKDYGRGIVIGDATTHGKGTVQNVMSVPPRLLAFLSRDGDHGALKLTISQFYRINGDSTQVAGVPSDVVLPSMIDHLDLGEKFLDNALPFDRIQPAKFTPVSGNLVSETVLSNLRQQSAARLAKDPKFQDLNEDIAKFLEKKEQKTVSLNEATRRAELAEAKERSDIEEELADESMGGANRPIFPDNFYNKEVLAITADYIENLNSARTAGR